MPTSDDIQIRHQQFLRAFTTNEPAVRAFVRRLVPSRIDADDVLQEVAIVLWEKYGEFKVLSWLRDKGRDRLVLDDDVVGLIADESIRKESHLEQQRVALESCFKKVPAEDRDLLIQAYQPDAKIQDIAVNSGRSVGGFYQWLHRMRLMLLECIQREQDRELL
jgi:RNA polymerase sigma-70 factor (ECF subfamily)